MQKLQDLLLRLEHVGLVVGNGILLANSLNYVMSLSQIVARHAWKKMVLNLKIQPAIPEIGQDVALHVSCRQHLPTEEIQIVVIAQHQHALVIRSEDRAHYQSENGLIDNEKVQHLPTIQKIE